MKNTFSTNSMLAVLLCGLIAVLAQPACADIVNIDSLNPNGSNEILSPGTYTVDVVGVAGGGSFDAWNPYGNVAGHFTDRFAIGFGANYTSNFTQYEVQNSSGTSVEYNDAASALSDYRAAIANGTLVQLVNDQTRETAPHPLTFTLSTPTEVGFFVRDSEYNDNFGGVSLSVTSAVPEPSTWAMMLLGFGGLGFFAHRKRQNAIA